MQGFQTELDFLKSSDQVSLLLLGAILMFPIFRNNISC